MVKPLKKVFLRFILFLFLPFAFLWDHTVQFGIKLSAHVKKFFKECSVCRELTACILSSVSATALIPLILLFL